MALTYHIDLRTWPRYHSMIHLTSLPEIKYIRSDARVIAHTHRLTLDVKTITPTADAGCKNEKELKLTF